ESPARGRVWSELGWRKRSAARGRGRTLRHFSGVGAQHLAVEPPPGEPEAGILADTGMEGAGSGAQDCEPCGICCQAEQGVEWIRCRGRGTWQRVNLGLDLLGAAHPGFRTDRARPISEARNV